MITYINEKTRVSKEIINLGKVIPIFLPLKKRIVLN